MSRPGADIRVRNVSVHYEVDGEAAPVLADLTLEVGAGQFVTLIGRSGCGKTTLLNVIAGLVQPTAGGVEVGGRPVKGPGGGKGVVFQNHALFPWLTALDNVVFGCRHNRMPAKARQVLGMQLLDLVGLRASARKYPRELSGGMQQRVAIARALALEPSILLMDEPFGALDEFTRIDLQSEILRIWSERRKTIVFVTHSIPEALVLSDRVIVMGARPGRVVDDIAVDLPRPRRASDSSLAVLHERIWKVL